MLRAPNTCSACHGYYASCSHFLQRFDQWLQDEPLPHVQHKVDQWHDDLVAKGYELHVMRSAGWQQIGKWNACMVTVNPDPEKVSEPAILKEYWERLIGYKVFQTDLAALMVIEQRSETECWEGYHMHIVLIRTKKSHNSNPATIRSCFEKTFSDIIGNTQHINVRYSNDPKNFVSYILGEKKKEKMEKVAQDQAMRQYYSLEKYYTTTTTTNYLINFQKNYNLPNVICHAKIDDVVNLQKNLGDIEDIEQPST